MRIKSLFALLCAAAPLFYVGCASTNQTPEAIAIQQIKLDVPFAVQVAVGFESNSAPYMRLASQVIRGAVDAGNFDIAKIQEAIAQANINELHTTAAIAAVQAGLTVYQLFAAQTVSGGLTKLGAAQILLAIADALDEGLARPPIILKGNPAAARRYENLCRKYHR